MSTQSTQDPPGRWAHLAPLFSKPPSLSEGEEEEEEVDSDSDAVSVSEEEDSDSDAVSDSDGSVCTVDSEDNLDDESYIRYRQEKTKLVVTDFLKQVQENKFADFPWPPPPKCPTYKQGMTSLYTKEFWFENESYTGEDYGTAKKFLHQVRTSWGYDVDCFPPKHLLRPSFFPIDMDNERLSRIYGEKIRRFAECAIKKINIQAEEIGKSYELLKIEKAVGTTNTMLLLTLTIKEKSCDAEKAIRVAVSSPPGCGGPEIVECKLVPSLSSSSSS